MTMTLSQRIGTALLTTSLALTASAFGTEGRSHDELPEAATILDRFVEVTGGKDAHLSIEERRWKGKLKIDMAGHKIDADVVKHSKAPGSQHIVMEGPFFNKVSVCDGVNAWEWSPSHGHHHHGEGSADHSHGDGVLKLLEGPEKGRALDGAAFHSVARWRQLLKEAKTVGVVDLDGKKAYELHVVTRNGDKQVRFYSQETGRLVKYTRTVEQSSMGRSDLEIYPSEYKEFDGVWLATVITHKIVSSKWGKGTQTWTFSEIDHDVQISSSLFAMPDELRDQIDG